jgi:ERI1 exoribonuclease 3
MTGMMNHLKIDIDGRHHSGIDDTKNITKIVDKVLRDGWKLN